MGVCERIQGANIVDAGRHSPYFGEHIVRYIFAADYVKGRSVLDIACGTGYGLIILQSKAKQVVGVDVDPGAVREAKAECNERTSVLLGNGLGLPFDDGVFDVVTSFETIEHLHHRNEFLAELRRVLKPDGKLILSTPNANYTRPVNGVPSNPFHVFEYKPAELRDELESLFFVENLLGQVQDGRIRISPFYEAQKRLPRDPITQAMLFGWKVMNKLPFRLREGLSGLIWGKPFYPTEDDYLFSEEKVDRAPVLVAVCNKNGA